ncbi:MAG: hypothetical protein R3Y43_00990 [Alphaproteobacteria bacterium]
MKKKDKLKFENIKPNTDVDFETCYKIATQQIADLQSTLQQLAATYKTKT